MWIGFIHRNRGDYARADSIGSIAERQRDRLGPFEQAALDRMLAEVRGDNEAAFAASRRVVAAAPTSDRAKCVTAEAALWINRPRTALRALEGVETRPGIKEPPPAEPRNDPPPPKERKSGRAAASRVLDGMGPFGAQGAPCDNSTKPGGSRA